MALDDDTLAGYAQHMLNDYDAADPGTLFRDDIKLSLEDAWRLQTAVSDLRQARGEEAIGYKIGAVSKINQREMDLPHAVWGRLWSSERHETGATLDLARYANLAVEAEFGVTLSQDVNAEADFETVLGSIDAVYPVLELHNLVFQGSGSRGAELVANNCIHCGVVQGEAVSAKLSNFKTDLMLSYDGTVIDQWDQLTWPQDIIGSVQTLARMLSDHGLTLKTGDLVLTGAWGPPRPVNDHRHIAARSSGFGDVFAEITSA